MLLLLNILAIAIVGYLLNRQLWTFRKEFHAHRLQQAANLQAVIDAINGKKSYKHCPKCGLSVNGEHNCDAR